jgi:hypothetical protein
MTEELPPESRPDPEAFAREAEERPAGVVREFWDFIRHYKKWWLVPILVLLLLTGVIAILGGSVVAPFIYTLF